MKLGRAYLAGGPTQEVGTNTEFGPNLYSKQSLFSLYAALLCAEARTPNKQV